MNTNRAEELLQQEGYDFMAAAFDVYNEIGSGFLEEVYQESLELELTERQIPFISRPKLTLPYKGRPLKKHYEADLIVIKEILVELKAAKTLAPNTRPSSLIISKPLASVLAISSTLVRFLFSNGSASYSDFY